MICGRKARPAAEQPRAPSDGAGGSRRSGRALKKMGLTEDEDIKQMLQGSLLRKVRARGGSRERLFRLQEDGVTVCFEGRFGRTRSPQSFSVTHVEGVREGHQSEGLRKHGAAFPERHCFTLVFKGRRKNLDLAARSEEHARHWVQGLTKLMGRLQAMSQMEKLDHWIHGVLQKADKNKDNKMSFQEVKNMLRMLNIDMDNVYASKLFKECDHSGNERLEGRELEEFCRRLLRRPELEELFGRYSGEDRVLSAEELRDFLRDQGEDSSLRQARAIIRKHELNDKARQQDLMMLDGFMMYLLSAAGDILNQEHTRVHQDMSQPLSHYFISSSHNTYLTRTQIGGTSSTEAYAKALRAGCRCVELDCWEGSDGEPVVYHGHTLTSKILFRDVIESIRRAAFERSPYPVILSLENHCGLEQQATMARHMKAILGDLLLTQPLQGQDPRDLPSPELKEKILVKGKKLPEPWQEPRGVTCLLDPEEEEEEEEEEEKMQDRSNRRSLQEIKPLQAKDALQVSPELSALVVYCQAVPFPGLAQALRHPQPCHMSSFSERKARKLIKEAGPALVRYNARQLSRVYPLGLKMNSANYNPQEMWNAGCHAPQLHSSGIRDGPEHRALPGQRGLWVRPEAPLPAQPPRGGVPAPGAAHQGDHGAAAAQAEQGQGQLHRGSLRARGGPRGASRLRPATDPAQAQQWVQPALGGDAAVPGGGPRAGPAPLRGGGLRQHLLQRLRGAVHAAPAQPAHRVPAHPPALQGRRVPVPGHALRARPVQEPVRSLGGPWEVPGRSPWDGGRRVPPWGATCSSGGWAPSCSLCGDSPGTLLPCLW
ncbi:1-phosphatidylinositol 4,5-bisphosphate phosphodiesterase delta-3 isoform X2 [Corapipo altera]|uniref:1-phosphatidylinositol 4,5-bisphosphate phosphodiesterase delta-3 isoform X2 n=1 Tax=Corapipo altera TaxID=415028 RepID=UPI000FD68739|nr:1-phosphatidylinositol 4,5-bisphosphate phosphodiesterase delta-3 isoform X2 [Corapipo altera]